MTNRITFVPSGRSLVVADGDTILDGALRCGESLSAECGGRGACGRCLVRIVEGEVPEYRILRREEGRPEVLACLTAVKGPLTILHYPSQSSPKTYRRP